LGYLSKPLSRNPEVGFFDDEDTQHVIAKIASTNRLTIFTGAGIATDLKIPDWSTLVARLLETLEHSRHADDEDCRSTVGFALDFFHQMPTASIVDALYRERYAHDAIEQRNRGIADILYPRDGQRGDQWVPEEALAIYVLRLAVAKRLAGCDVHIVTTNYDDSLERIADSHKDMLSDLGSQGVRVFSNSDATDNGPAEGVPVSHVHGFIPHDGPGRHVVFAEREYIEWAPAGPWTPWKSATANAPAPKTVSAASKTPGCATCPSTATRPTRSGSRSSPWPPICSPGPKPSLGPNTNPLDDGNPNDYGCASSPSPAASSAAAADNGSDYPRLALEPPHRHRIRRAPALPKPRTPIPPQGTRRPRESARVVAVAVLRRRRPARSCVRPEAGQPIPG
jgi:hypothetical protein